MDRLELHDVEYGDCTVLVGRDNSVLMVACGSVSRYTRQDETESDRRFEASFSRYDGARQRQFLLTHCHRDHMNGFLKKLRRDPGYFDRVYIPALPVAERGANPILEFAVFSHFFSVPQSDFAQINTDVYKRQPCRRRAPRPLRSPHTAPAAGCSRSCRA